MNKKWTKLGLFVICTFALIGFILTFTYIAVRFGWTNTPGIIDNQHDYFKNQKTISKTSDVTTSGVSTVIARTKDRAGTSSISTISETSTSIRNEAWKQGDEWQTLKLAIIKDSESINKAAIKAEIPPRLIVSILIVEQLRLFHSNREIFKQIFAPLRVLGNQSQFSWGVMGIKQDTARQIEDNLKDTKSPYYLGIDFEHMLDFSTTTNVDTLRFNRLTSDQDRYYSYLYSGVMIKEIETQWQKTGFPISKRPDILATLFNIGFKNSQPHANPQTGGAEISINSTVYSFGGLALNFYNSNELLDEFPR